MVAPFPMCYYYGYKKIDVDEIMFNSGGGGTNTAATFAKQGFKTAFCGAIGNDIAGKEIGAGEWLISGNDLQNFEIRTPEAGLYLLNIMDGNNTKVIKLVSTGEGK